MISNSTLELLENEIKEFIETINNLDKVNIIRSDSKYAKEEVEEFSKRYRSVLDEIKRKINVLTKELHNIKQMDWKTINIAFFGETNAGKSTLIEAITQGDGSTIGDGRKDYTRSVNTYSISNGIKLLDMPGIEGKEEEIKEEIHKAVNKAHIVFYVHPDDKEPERGTIKKIKNYLRKNAEVYTILNIRGIFPPQILEQKFNSAVKIQKRTDKHLKENLGNIYKGSLQVHALFGFFGRAQKIPSHLEEKYKSAIKLYGSKENLKKASRIEEIISLMQNWSSSDYQLKILWGNFHKILLTQEEILSRILNFKKELDKTIKDLQKELKQLQRKFEREKSTLENNISRIIELHTFRLKVNLKKIVHSSIENELDEKRLEFLIKSEINVFKENLRKELESEINDFKDRILEDIHSLLRHIKSVSSIKVNIDLKNIIDEISYTFTDILNEIKDVALKIIGIFLTYLANPIIGIIIGILNLLEKIFDWFFGNSSEKKAKAKQKANQHIEESIAKVKKDINKKIGKTYREIDKQFKKVIKEIHKANKNLNYLSKTLDPIIHKFMESNLLVATLFTKEIDKSAEFGFIQIKLKEGASAAIVTHNPWNIKLKLKQLGIKNVYTFNSLEELKHKVNNYENEFFKRLNRVIRQGNKIQPSKLTN